MIQPLGNRVLVKPDPPPDQTASGLVIPDNAHASKDFEMAGTVVKVGNGPAAAHRVREAMIARFHQMVDDVCGQSELLFDAKGGVRYARKELHLLLNERAMLNLSEIKVGDHVAFPYTAGTVIVVDGERHLLLPEDQIVAVLGEEVAA